MKISKITFRGEKLPVQPAAESTDELKIEEVYSVGAATRAGGETQEIRLKKDQLVEFVFDDNTVWLSSESTIGDLFPEAATQKKRSGDEQFEVPFYLEGETGERGIVGNVALKLLKVFSKKAVQKSVRALAEELEKKQLDNKSGLFRLDTEFSFHKDIPADPGKPFLLFLHGTNSSTLGSFGEIKGTGLWKYILEEYDQRILAFQHETLTKSPLANLADLVRQLPSRATLHLISHSRGGIVGDLLSRFCTGDEKKSGFSETEQKLLEKEGRDEDLKQIKAIGKELEKKNISVQKFIRVACPASGTTLASGRLDHFFNISFNLIGLATGGSANPVFNAFKNLVAAVVDTKNDVNVLPGLEAMNPDSPLLKILNYPRPDAVIDSSLMIISGNSRASLRFKALLIIASKLFFNSKNDLVVNTASMYNGSKRLKKVQYFFDEGSKVDHFNYFEKDAETNAAILNALKSDGETLVPGFAWLEQGAAVADERNALLKLDGGQVFRNTVTGKRPIVVLLPGIMGSNLEKNGNLVWINYFRFLAGELTTLKTAANDGVKATSLIRTSYKKLADCLSETYDVVTYPFDWRHQLNESAKLFNDKILELLEFRQPLKIIGHSMGGVLVRDFIITHPDTWKKLNDSPGFHLLFLGSPLGGSFRILYTLYGKDPIIDKLSKIDILNSKKDLLKVFSNFPGLLSLLPLNEDPEFDFASKATWDKMNKGIRDAAWPIPNDDQRKIFGAYRKRINEQAGEIDFSHASYIAGRDKSTVSGFEYDEDGNLVFLSTAAGDQSVTWDSGIPQKMIETKSVYYADVTHGGLSNENSLFKAISEILEFGSTLLLKKTRPALRSAEETFRTPDLSDFDLSADGLENTILGLGAGWDTLAGEAPIKVSISNGDLKYAAYPLLAGHFKNDGILFAEKAIDYYLDGLLTERYRLGLYPGAIGTNAVVIKSGQVFRGAIILGLGDPGTLTSFELAQSVEQGVTSYLLEFNRNTIQEKRNADRDRVGISSLAIACSYGGLSLENSMRAVVLGVQQANAKIRQVLGEGARLATHIEFVEQYIDKALASFYILDKMEKEEDRSLNVVFAKRRIRRLPGAKERLPVEDQGEWWTRINVRLKDFGLEGKPGQEYQAVVRGLQFNISTGAAREEQRDLPTSREIVQALIQEMSVNNQWTPQLAKTIFELLVPNDFKEQLKKQANINWIVDKDTASYPWELLQDSANKARPLCINAGMVRQLATQHYRILIQPSAKDNVLVIADPDLKGFVNQLPGALREGELVAEMLGASGFNTVKISKGNSSDIIQGLFSDEYRVIHLAGHGIFNEDPSKPSGMVIGNNVFLTTREINQMSRVPELVFVNCCFLGKTEGEAETFARSRFKLAANIGTQLIEIGVKAVIAAGWAVDDSAALEFTRVFYENMLEGVEFGKAVLEARQQVFEKFRQTNTWGAYQCYGDQFYTFRKTYRRQRERSYAIETEAEIDLNNLVNSLEAGNYVVANILDELNDISKAVEKSRIRNAAITEKEGLIYASMCDYGRAISKFESLLKMENASFSFSAMEKYCNVRPKYYVSETRKDRKNQKDYLKKMDKVIADLDLLLSYSPTSERLSLMGSAWKNKAILSLDKESKIAAYKEAAGCYQEAYQKQKASYPLTNWLEIEAILLILKSGKWDHRARKSRRGMYKLPPVKDVVRLLQQSLKKLISTADEDTGYWEWITAANIRLCLMMIPYKARGYKAPGYEEVLNEYLVTWKKAGSPGKKKGEIEHLEFLEDAIGLVDSRSAKSLGNKIKDLKEHLENLL